MPAKQRPEEELSGDLRLVQDEVVHALEFLVPGSKEGPSGDHQGARFITAGDHQSGRPGLDGHAAEKHKISPPKLLVCERSQVEIDEPFVPHGWKHGCDGQQAEQWLPSLLRYESKSILERLERVWVFGADGEHLHGRVLFGKTFRHDDGDRSVLPANPPKRRLAWQSEGQQSPATLLLARILPILALARSSRRTLAFH